MVSIDKYTYNIYNVAKEKLAIERNRFDIQTMINYS